MQKKKNCLRKTHSEESSDKKLSNKGNSVRIPSDPYYEFTSTT